MAMAYSEQERTLEVPRERWSSFVKTLSEQTRDRPVRVEVIDPTIGDQPLSSTAPFRSLEWVERGSAKDTLELDLGLDANLDHRVLNPRRLFVRLSSGGDVEALDIEDEQQARTLISFERPLAMLPRGPKLRRR